MEDFSNFFLQKIKLFKNSESIYVNLENVTSCMFQNVHSNTIIIFYTFDEESWFEIIFHEFFNHIAWNYANHLFKSFSRKKNKISISQVLSTTNIGNNNNENDYKLMILYEICKPTK